MFVVHHLSDVVVQTRGWSPIHLVVRPRPSSYFHLYTILSWYPLFLAHEDMIRSTMSTSGSFLWLCCTATRKIPVKLSGFNCNRRTMARSSTISQESAAALRQGLPEVRSRAQAQRGRPHPLRVVYFEQGLRSHPAKPSARRDCHPQDKGLGRVSCAGWREACCGSWSETPPRAEEGGMVLLWENKQMIVLVGGEVVESGGGSWRRVVCR